MDSNYGMITKTNSNKSNFSIIESMKKKRRRVTFSSENNVREIGNRTNSITTGDYTTTASNTTNECWYSPSELEAMRNDVKIQARIHRKFLNKDCFNAAQMSSLVMPFCNSGVENRMAALCKSSSSFRGLEPRIFVEKQRNRIIATSTVLEYQRRTGEIIIAAKEECVADVDFEAMKKGFANRLGTICKQLSKWSTDEAQAIASYDANGIYNSTAHSVMKQAEMMTIETKPVRLEMHSMKEQETSMKNTNAEIASMARKRSSTIKQMEIPTVTKRSRTVSPALLCSSS